MLKKTLIALTLPLLSLLAIGAGNYTTGSGQKTADAPTGTLQKMIVENGSVTMDLDLNGLNPQNSSGSLTARPLTLQFAVGANSFFPILVFNDLLRGLEPGSMALIPAGVNAPGYSNLPAALGASFKRLVVEKLPSGQGFDLAVRDGNTGFTFFNVEGHEDRLQPRCAGACHHEWQVARFKGVCQRAWPSIERRCSGWKNLRRHDNASGPDRPSS